MLIPHPLITILCREILMNVDQVIIPIEMVMYGQKNISDVNNLSMPGWKTMQETLVQSVKA